MKKIMFVQGGGRPRGNTFQLAQAFMQGAMEDGHQLTYYPRNKYIVNSCLGCNACRYGKPCIQNDDFNTLRPVIMEADCIVFASPLLLAYAHEIAA